jgi:molecular chaperone DnaK (HSP70)
MSTPIDVGIDFGTTNCAIGRVDPEGREPVRGPLPSVGAWREGRAVFGEEARRLLSSAEPGVYAVRDLKLLLGRPEYVRLGETLVDPVGLAAQLLQHVKNRFFPKDDVRTAVIGTPVRVPREHRVAVREAARQAGFGSVRFVYEPTAALIGCWEGSRSGNDLVLVIDWGGGTLDIAAVRVEANLYREISVDGDIADLGGSQIDREITRRVLKLPQHRAVRAAVEKEPGGLGRFSQAVEEKKISLLGDPFGRDAEPEIINPAWLPEEAELPAPLVHDVMKEFALKARQRIEENLRKSGVRPEEVTHVLFAGGVCKSDVVRQEVRNSFPDAEIVESPDPQLQTALGCARLTAPRLRFAVELAADLAVRQCDDTLCVLMSRGQPVELNSYRVAEFMVSDALAPEAIFDVGVCSYDPTRDPMHSAAATTFRSLRHMFVRTGSAELPGGESVADIVLMHAGVEANLVVGVHLRSNRSNAQAQEFLSGVPLAIRVQEDGR